MPRLNLIARPQPLIGILVVSAGWALSHQWGSNTVFDNCAASGRPVVILASLVGLVLVAAGGIYSFVGWRGPGGTGRRFLGALGTLMAPIAAFAVLLQIAAGLILPACAA
jgi:hypothetical protein